MSLPISAANHAPATHKTDLLVLLVREGALGARDGLDAREGGGLDARESGVDGQLDALDARLDGLLARVAKDEDFSGKEGQLLSLHTHGKLPAQRVALIGLGRAKDNDRTLEQLRAAAGRAVKLAKGTGAKTAALSWPGNSAEEARALTEGASLGAYVFDRYKKDKKPSRLQKLTLLSDVKIGSAIELGRATADAVCRARDLVNEPASRITPQALAAEARQVAKSAGLRCEVFGRAQIEKLDMRLFLAVSQGSAEEPQLVRLTYTPARASKKPPIALVGKAITFDSGGLSIKTASGMEEMKTDMAGAAAVISAMELIGRMKPPFPVRGYFGACENLPSGTAYKPGDVVVGKGGLSVEILNTDAEGRLVLADVLAWAMEDEPAAIVDLATLTGAIIVALGPWTAGLFSNDDDLANELLDAARTTGESVWRMPLPSEMEELIKSPIADLKNTGGRFGGSINAALFLQHFVQGDRKVPWAHLDIAGPSSVDRERPYTPRGATGCGVRLLAEWIERRARG